MPSNPNRKAALALLAVLSLAIVAYSVVVVQQILLGVILAGVPWLLYLFVRFVRILDRIATALERIAVTRTDESGPPAGDSTRPSASSERATESDGGVERE